MSYNIRIIDCKLLTIICMHVNSRITYFTYYLLPIITNWKANYINNCLCCTTLKSDWTRDIFDNTKLLKGDFNVTLKQHINDVLSWKLITPWIPDSFISPSSSDCPLKHSCVGSLAGDRSRSATENGKWVVLTMIFPLQIKMMRQTAFWGE